jgi:GT2 family glycosyltransferase
MNSEPTSPVLSVIIVNWNTRQLLSQCLRSAVENLHGLSIETFVIDNGSIDGSVEMVRDDFPGVTLIKNQENLGFAKANNQAIRLSHGIYILLLNSDAFLTPNAIQTMLTVMESDPSAGIAGARLVYPDGRAQVSHGPLPTYWSEVASLFSLDKYHKQIITSSIYQETGMVSGACMLIRKSLLNQVGLLDESFFMFSEEVDLCFRCHSASYKVLYINSATVIHTHAGSTGQTVQRIVRLYSGKLHYFYKHFGSNVENRLKHMMVIASLLKGFFYFFIRIISFGRIHKDDFWWDVTKKIWILPQ